MKVIFLDIDGVIITDMTLKERLKKNSLANPECIEQLNRIISETDAKIVISSAWRFCGIQEMQLLLIFWGCNGEVIGATDDLNELDVDNRVRSNEILSYLKSYKNISNFVILDDCFVYDFENCCGPTNKLIKTKCNTGLTKELADKAIEILKRDNNGKS